MLRVIDLQPLEIIHMLKDIKQKLPGLIPTLKDIKPQLKGIILMQMENFH